MARAKSLPIACLRGIRKNDHRNSEGYALAAAFLADDRDGTLEKRAAEKRLPQAFETSINWEVDPVKAMRILHEDVENSKFGIALISAEHLKGVKNHTLGKSFGWECAPLAGKRANPYHGNLLFLDCESKARRRELAGVIAAGLAKPLTLDEVEQRLTFYHDGGAGRPGVWAQLIEAVKSVIIRRLRR